ncbi:MAG: response regulator [Humidesulfovibrio sp.]|uniref:response regulator n=1 Tax=Humidesulfovibrio sp. TaxID=2910988 RepID=UPI00273286C2|nr:response regulator [Humidesulfovibrio sp.]MDP2848533.1 response regulator [Humidesulfovibrio sp.]
MNHPARILIIDDEERIRHLLQDYLEDFEDYALRASESAEDALEQLSHETAELCIVDMRLPGMDGQAFILQAEKRQLCDRFILHTGSMDFTLTKELRESGLTEDDVFFKPCNMDEMLARIRQILKLPGDAA